jgi:di/tricarboxylate transporter
LIANAASFVLPISNPANLVVFHTGMPQLGTWLADFGVPSLFSILVTFFVMRFRFRDDLCKSIDCEVEDTKLSGNGRLVLAGLALMIAVLLTASALKKDLGLPRGCRIDPIAGNRPELREFAVRRTGRTSPFALIVLLEEMSYDRCGGGDRWKAGPRI